MSQKIITVIQGHGSDQQALQSLLDAGWYVVQATPLHGYQMNNHAHNEGEVQYILQDDVAL